MIQFDEMNDLVLHAPWVFNHSVTNKATKQLEGAFDTAQLPCEPVRPITSYRGPVE